MFHFLVMQKVWVVCGFMCASDVCNIFSDRCLKSSRLRPVCYFHLQWNLDEVIKWKWGESSGKLLAEAFWEVLLPLLDHLDLFLVHVWGFNPCFFFRYQFQYLALTSFLWPGPCFSIHPNTSVPAVGSCDALSILVMGRHLPCNPAMLSSGWWAVWTYSILVIPGLFLLFLPTSNPPLSNTQLKAVSLLLVAVSFRDGCHLSHRTSFIPAAGVTSLVLPQPRWEGGLQFLAPWLQTTWQYLVMKPLTSHLSLPGSRFLRQ